ncbi:hypothetical protein GLYMA_12G123750v4 [Glycine max]|nr:hypothetical protein GLYMA_12G123750v4 [Glycine max]KAH1142864.1 hypothetical protein GYH30_033524 [Glycine max]
MISTTPVLLLFTLCSLVSFLSSLDMSQVMLNVTSVSPSPSHLNILT